MIEIDIYQSQFQFGLKCATFLPSNSNILIKPSANLMLCNAMQNTKLVNVECYVGRMHFLKGINERLKNDLY